jgi:phosphopantetheinyl transferase (holo-ACP synthase)
MTVSMEIMAEVAATLLPGKLLTRMRDIRAHKWISVDDEPVTLHVTARTSAKPEEVKVQIQNMSDSEDAQNGLEDSPAIEGTMIFADAYPEAPQATEFSPKSARPSRYTAEEIYKENLMFHGPRFQGVVSIDACGEDGVLGRLQALPNTEIFRSNPNPSFIIDPFLIDAAGQLVGYWPMEYLDTGFLAFPIRVGELQLYGPNQPPSEYLNCQVRMRQVTSQQISADVEMIGPDGRIWMRLIRWQDWRFYIPIEFFIFWRDPKTLALSTPWDTPISKIPALESFECYRLDGFEPNQMVSRDLCVNLILSRAEREVWQNLQQTLQSEAEINEWLLGRWVAKDAVRMFLKKHHGMELYPADIEITVDEDGRLVPQGTWTRDIEALPALSLAQATGIAVAMTGYCQDGQRLGIGVQHITDHPLPMAYHEQELLSQLSQSPHTRESRQEWMTRISCTKEAVAKALGRNLIKNPQSLTVQEMNVQTGAIEVILQGELADEFPELADTQIIAYTAKAEDYIIASSICEAS